MVFWSAARSDVGFLACDCQSSFGNGDNVLTSGFSPCLKKASSPFPLLPLFSLAKYSGLETFSRIFSSTDEMSTLVEVAITQRAFTRRKGQPLQTNGPVTSRTPWSRCLRTIVLFPRKRPARRMTTVPGVMDARVLAGRMALRVCCNNQVSKRRQKCNAMMCRGRGMSYLPLFLKTKQFSVATHRKGSTDLSVDLDSQC